jgi:DNA-binding winged helix-turn-helix (wHTH) protein
MYSFSSPRHSFDNNTMPGLAPAGSRADLPATVALPVHAAPLRFGRCEVRVASREVLVDGLPRALQPRPFDLLVYLIESRDRVRTTDELLDQIWRHEMVQPGSLAAAVMRIRQALCDGSPGIGQVIRTYPRVGYRFVAVLDGDRPR